MHFKKNSVGLGLIFDDNSRQKDRPIWSAHISESGRFLPHKADSQEKMRRKNRVPRAAQKSGQKGF